MKKMKDRETYEQTWKIKNKKDLKNNEKMRSIMKNT